MSDRPIHVLGGRGWWWQSGVRNYGDPGSELNEPAFFAAWLARPSNESVIVSAADADAMETALGEKGVEWDREVVAVRYTRRTRALR